MWLSSELLKTPVVVLLTDGNNMAKAKINRDQKNDKGAAIEQFERYKETGKGSLMKTNENKLGYSEAYAEGWQRIFGKKEEEEVVEEVEETEDK